MVHLNSQRTHLNFLSMTLRRIWQNLFICLHSSWNSLVASNHGTYSQLPDKQDRKYFLSQQLNCDAIPSHASMHLQSWLPANSIRLAEAARTWAVVNIRTAVSWYVKNRQMKPFAGVARMQWSVKAGYWRWNHLRRPQKSLAQAWAALSKAGCRLTLMQRCHPKALPPHKQTFLIS